jgi:hypothetical protein
MTIRPQSYGIANVSPHASGGTADCWPGRWCIASWEIDKPALVQAVPYRPLADLPNDRLTFLLSRVRCGTAPLIQIKPSGRAAILPLLLGRERSPSGEWHETVTRVPDSCKGRLEC